MHVIWIHLCPQKTRPFTESLSVCSLGNKQAHMQGNTFTNEETSVKRQHTETMETWICEEGDWDITVPRARENMATKLGGIGRRQLSLLKLYGPKSEQKDLIHPDLDRVGYNHSKATRVFVCVFTWKELHVAPICSTWLWQKKSKYDSPPTHPLPKALHGLQGNLRQTVSPTTATALIKALMIGFQPRWNLSSHIITRRQLVLAELQPSGLQRTHSDHSSYSTSASSVVGLVLLNPVTATTSLRSWGKTSSAVLIWVGECHL